MRRYEKCKVGTKSQYVRERENTAGAARSLRCSYGSATTTEHEHNGRSRPGMLRREVLLPPSEESAEEARVQCFAYCREGPAEVKS